MKFKDIGEEVFLEFEIRKEVIELFGFTRFYFPELLNKLTDTIQIFKESKDVKELTKTMYTLMDRIEKEQLNYIINKNKIKFK